MFKMFHVKSAINNDLPDFFHEGCQFWIWYHTWQKHVTSLKLKLEKIHVFSMFSRVLIFCWQNQDHARLNWVFAAEKSQFSQHFVIESRNLSYIIFSRFLFLILFSTSFTAFSGLWISWGFFNISREIYYTFMRFWPDFWCVSPRQ